MKSMAVEEGLVQLRAKRGWASVSLPLPAFLPTVSWALGTSNNLISAVICIWKWIRIWVRWKALLGWACGTAQGHRNKLCGTAVQGAEQKILSALLIQVFCLLRACSTCPCTAVSCCAMGLVQVSAWLASAAFAIWKSNSVNWCSCPTSHRTAPGYLLFTCLPQLGCGVSVIGECFDLFFSGNPKWLFLIMRTGENSACHFT